MSVIQIVAAVAPRERLAADQALSGGFGLAEAYIKAASRYVHVGWLRSILVHRAESEDRHQLLGLS